MLDRKLENQRGMVRHLINLGIVTWEQSEFVQAQAYLEAALSFALWETTGEQAHGERAVVLYRELAAATPKAIYHERRDALQIGLSGST